MLHYFQGRQKGRITRNGDVFELDLSLLLFNPRWMGALMLMLTTEDTSYC
jgi:hypothetical protein